MHNLNKLTRWLISSANAALKLLTKSRFHFAKIQSNCSFSVLVFRSISSLPNMWLFCFSFRWQHIRLFLSNGLSYTTKIFAWKGVSDICLTEVKAPVQHGWSDLRGHKLRWVQIKYFYALLLSSFICYHCSTFAILSKRHKNIMKKGLRPFPTIRLWSQTCLNAAKVKLKSRTFSKTNSIVGHKRWKM